MHGAGFTVLVLSNHRREFSLFPPNPTPRQSSPWPPSMDQAIRTALKLMTGPNGAGPSRGTSHLSPAHTLPFGHRHRPGPLCALGTPFCVPLKAPPRPGVHRLQDVFPDCTPSSFPANLWIAVALFSQHSAGAAALL